MTEIIETRANILDEKSKRHAFDLAQAELKPDDPMEHALSVILDDVSSTICAFCHGLGHEARRCSSKKNVDKATEKLRGIKILWGSLKSKYKSTASQSSAVGAGVKRLAKQK